MLVLTPALLEHPLLMECAKLVLKLAHQVNIGTELQHHAEIVNILVPNVH